MTITVPIQAERYLILDFQGATTSKGMAANVANC